MYLRIILFLATCCVINASVITVNVFDDDFNNVAESEDGLSLSSCNPQECDQRCRRLRFPGGVCVNGRCKCDNFRTSEDFAALIEEYDSLRNCYPRECYRKCRKMHYPKGLCVNGECKCLKPQEAEDDLQQSLEEAEDYSSLKSCNPQECDQRCRRLKFPGGVCVHGRCKCDNFRTSEDFAAIIEEFNSFGKCYPKECEQRCRRLKFPGGACVNGRCKCDNFRTSEALLFSSFHPEDLMSTTNCVSQDCNERCQRLGFAGGKCIKDGCVCKNTKISKDDITESVEANSEPVDSSKIRVCRPNTCSRQCQLRHFKDGTCFKGFCKCTNKGPNMPDAATDLEESNLNLNEEEGDIEDNTGEHERVTRDKCFQYKCNDSCLRVGHVGGLCKKNKCKCY